MGKQNYCNNCREPLLLTSCNVAVDPWEVVQPQRVHQGGGAGYPGAAGEPDEGVEGGHDGHGVGRGIGEDQAQENDARHEMAEAGEPDQV